MMMNLSTMMTSLALAVALPLAWSAPPDEMTPPPEADPPATESQDSTPPDMMDPDAPPDMMDPETTQAEAILRGPEVERHGIIQFNFRGEFVPVIGRPEESALELLGREPARAEAVRLAADERIRQLTLLLSDQINLIRDASDATKAGETNRTQQLYRELYEQFDPDHTRDPLLDAVADTLTPDELAEATMLVDDYWDAWVAWELRNSKDDSEARKQRAREVLGFRLFQREFQEAYRIALLPYAQKLERMAAAIEPTDELREEIRQVILDHIREARMAPTEEQRKEVTRTIYEMLDEEGRERLLEYVLWEM